MPWNEGTIPISRQVSSHSRYKTLNMTLQIPRAPGTASWSPVFDRHAYSSTASITTGLDLNPRSSYSLPSLPLFLEARSHAIAEPLKPAIIDKTKNESFTYLDLLSDVAVFKTKIQHVLENYGKSKANASQEEPRISFLVPAGYDYVVAQWAIWAVGAICVPLCMFNFFLVIANTNGDIAGTTHPLNELLYTISDSDPSLIIIHPSFQGLEAGLRSKAQDVPLLRFDPSSKSTNLDKSPTLPQFANSPPLSQRALIIYTSGTTSRPKGCVTTHETLAFQARSLVQAWKYQRSDHLIHMLPLHHVHGVINGLTATLLAGGTVEMYSKFDPKIVWDRWSEVGSSTMFMAVPTVYSRLIDYFDTNIRGSQSESAARQGAQALRLTVSGSAALPVSTKQRFREITGHELLERYGMTEVGMALSCGLDTTQRTSGSVGWPLPGVRVRLVEPETKQMITSSGKDESGLIEIQGPNLFAEYFRQPEVTAESFTEDGWFKTGDVAKRDAQGAYFILGRESVDLIKSGGYKISALEVERKILGNAQLGAIVSEVVVVGVEDADWGQRVAAVVKMKLPVSPNGSTISILPIHNKI